MKKQLIFKVFKEIHILSKVQLFYFIGCIKHFTLRGWETKRGEGDISKKGEHLKPLSLFPFFHEKRGKFINGGCGEI